MSDEIFDADMRALLDCGRDQLAPDPETVARLRRKVETAVAVTGAGVGFAGIAKGLGAKALGVKLVVIATVAVTTAAAVHVVRAVRVVPASVPEIAIAPAPELDSSEPVHPSIAVVTREPPPAVEAPPAAPPVSAQLPGAPSVKSLPPPHATLARETALVELATRALRAGDLVVVRDAIATYVRETGASGQLAEDIGAIEVEALCRANDPSAPTKLAAFDARWPHAGQRRRLSAACQGDH